MLNTNIDKNILLYIYTTENSFNDVTMTKNATKVKYKGKSKTN